METIKQKGALIRDQIIAEDKRQRVPATLRTYTETYLRQRVPAKLRTHTETYLRADNLGNEVGWPPSSHLIGHKSSPSTESLANFCLDSCKSARLKFYGAGACQVRYARLRLIRNFVTETGQLIAGKLHGRFFTAGARCWQRSTTVRR